MRLGMNRKAKAMKHSPRPRRRAAKSPGHEGRFELGSRLIDDPLEPGAHVLAAVNVRESAIAHMASRGRLDPAQEAAGERFRALWEQAGIGRSRGIDFSQEAVDGGRLGDPVSDALVRAARELSDALAAVGQVAAAVLIGIVGEGRRVEDMAAAWSQAGGVVSGRRAEGYITGTLVDALDALVRHWKLQAEGKPKLAHTWYRRAGQKVATEDDIVASGPIRLTGPANEITIGRFGDAAVRPVEPRRTAAKGKGGAERGGRSGGRRG
jgi:hypothetical protein